MKTQGYLCLYCKLKLLFEKATLWIPHLQAGLSERPTELFQDLRLYRETDTNNLFIFLFSFFLFSPFFFFQFKQSQNKWTKQTKPKKPNQSAHWYFLFCLQMKQITPAISKELFLQSWTNSFNNTICIPKIQLSCCCHWLWWSTCASGKQKWIRKGLEK